VAPTRGEVDAGGETDAGGEADAGTTEVDAGGDACASVSSEIASNHGHTLEVPLADVTAGDARSYDIQGTSGHTHTVDVSADDFATLLADGSVMIDSSLDSAHTHTVTIVCAS